MPDRVPCKTCQSLILPQTVGTYGGRCAACFKRREKKAVHDFCRSAIRELPQLVLLPWEAVCYGVRCAVMQWTFPYDRKALLQAIRQVHPETSVAKTYLQGVIKGYFEKRDVLIGWSRNRAKTAGENDGARLWHQEIALAEIPTTRHDLTPTKPQKGVKYRQV